MTTFYKDHDSAYFLQGGAPWHKAREVKERLHEHEIQRMARP